MTQAEYEVVAGELMALAQSIEDSKRGGYTRGSDDVLANFKRAAEYAGVEAGQAWAVFFLKHVDAIVSMMTRPELPVSEEPQGRYADAINYLRLGWALLQEQSGAARQPAPSVALPAPSVPVEWDWSVGPDHAGQVSTTTQPSVLSVDTAGPCQYVTAEKMSR